jgi:hypothetical protein
MGSGMKIGDRVKVEFEGIVRDIYRDGQVKIQNNAAYMTFVDTSQCTVLPDPEPEIALVDGRVWYRTHSGYYWCSESAYEGYTWRRLQEQLGAVPAKAVPA